MSIDRFIRLYIIGYKRYIRSKGYKKLREFIDREYSEVMGITRKLTCPFCGRRFSSKRGIMRHLHGGRCAEAFSYLVLEVVDRYREVKGAGA